MQVIASWFLFLLPSIKCTDQASAFATEAGVLQPSPHVLVGADDQ